MRDLSGRVAVVTGAASGIGKGLAERFAKEGMKVALADIEADALEVASKEVESAGADVLAVPTDVSDKSEVEALADQVYSKFGGANILCNNAGVSTGGRNLWETTAKDWEWVLGVNLMGVVHGVQSFVPRMIASGQEGHIVNTSSILGVSTGKGSIYAATKHAVARFTEGLYYELQESGHPIGVSLLCPGLIATGIIHSERNRPRHLINEEEEEPTPQRQTIRAEVQRLFSERGMPPSEVAEIVVNGIRESRFYIFTHPNMLSRVEDRMKGILEGTPPESGAVGMEELVRQRLQEARGET